MKNIDVKSLIIGVLLTATIFLGVASTSPTDKWDDKQNWHTADADFLHKEGRRLGLAVSGEGWEPFAWNSASGGVKYRKRVK